ncbi:hypothetical protein [Longimycelium tulufanense]|uniref:hypothetical protein n=1 Tax=Longimycelium tulufanense TaxID=907463 RepID=UPI00166696D6|nr:hypothetical protein [Longimycelium tulufanense]
MTTDRGPGGDVNRARQPSPVWPRTRRPERSTACRKIRTLLRAEAWREVTEC